MNLTTAKAAWCFGAFDSIHSAESCSRPPSCGRAGRPLLSSQSSRAASEKWWLSYTSSGPGQCLCRRQLDSLLLPSTVDPFSHAASSPHRVVLTFRHFFFHVPSCQIVLSHDQSALLEAQSWHFVKEIWLYIMQGGLMGRRLGARPACFIVSDSQSQFLKKNMASVSSAYTKSLTKLPYQLLPLFLFMGSVATQ